MDEGVYTTVVLPKYMDSIEKLARKLARRDQELYDDLRQEGMITLWGLDFTRATKNEDAWVRQALWNNMVSFLRRERRAKYESLEAHLARGEQLYQGPDGEPTLLHQCRDTRRVGSDDDPGDPESDE